MTEISYYQNGMFPKPFRKDHLQVAGPYNPPTQYDPASFNQAKAPEVALRDKGLPDRIVGESVYATIPGGPRAQTINSLTRTTPSNKWQKAPYEDGRCYAAYSHNQMLSGAICASEDNAHHARGREHAVAYSPELLYERRQYEFAGREPPKRPGNLYGQKIISDSPFYPIPNLNLFEGSTSDKYKTYPHFNNYYKDKPFYVYPYET